MRIRRCAPLAVEPRERMEFDLARLFAGGTGVGAVREWVALAAHRDGECVLDADQFALLGAVSPEDWQDAAALAAAHGQPALDHLLDAGLLVSDAPAHADAREADERVRAGHWRGLAAVLHRHSRWQGVDTLEAERRFVREGDRSFLDRLGPPRPLLRERTDAPWRIALELAPDEDSALETLLHRRVTCRNFDADKPVSARDFSAILKRCFGARAVTDLPGIPVMKRAVPSAGGLHPTEAYLLVQHVEGVAPGLYHYHPLDHALEPLRALEPAAARDLAQRLVAGQRHFTDAHVQVVYASRVPRTTWKYRNHMKAYRAVVLDVGHLSQMLYLAATERGLAAFVTAAVNEIDIEREFDLDPMQEGVIAIGGFGHRAATLTENELDPLGVVWGTPTA